MSDKAAAKTRFIKEVQKAVDPFDFMIFQVLSHRTRYSFVAKPVQEYNHGAWLPLFDRMVKTSPWTSVQEQAKTPMMQPFLSSYLYERSKLTLLIVSGLGLKRIILGNPLIAQTMLQHESRAGLFVPVEILVQELAESEGGGTFIIYDLPSSSIANQVFRPEKELVNASTILY